MSYLRSKMIWKSLLGNLETIKDFLEEFIREFRDNKDDLEEFVRNLETINDFWCYYGNNL